MKKHTFLILSFAIISVTSQLTAQEDNSLKLSGDLLTDQRFLMNRSKDWAWNENRLSLKLDKKFTGNSKFHTEVWLRNFGLPAISESADLYNKGIIDPWDLEIREAYLQLNGFLTKNLDLTIGRQSMVWGTADKLNPTDNLNPYDLEDLLDFGRHRGSDAINLNYWLNNDFSLQAVYIPIFQPANMPAGVFSTVFNPSVDLPQGMVLKGLNDSLIMPRYNLKESSTAGFKFKGFAKGVDFSLSYVWGYDGIPFNTRNTFIPVDMAGATQINSQLSFSRTHIIGADMATSIGGAGLWAEAAAFIPDGSVLLTNDVSAFYPGSPMPVTQDTVVLDKTKPYVKFVVGTDYNFSDGSYLNFQYMHGYVHERGQGNLNDYLFMKYEKKFFNDKLKVVPIGGGIVVSDWSRIKENYAYAYMPEISYIATENAEITLSAFITDGKGKNMFAKLSSYDMIMVKLKYSF
jgi:hypothetical protein